MLKEKEKSLWKTSTITSVQILTTTKSLTSKWRIVGIKPTVESDGLSTTNTFTTREGVGHASNYDDDPQSQGDDGSSRTSCVEFRPGEFLQEEKLAYLNTKDMEEDMSEGAAMRIQPCGKNCNHWSQSFLSYHSWTTLHQKGKSDFWMPKPYVLVII